MKNYVIGLALSGILCSTYGCTNVSKPSEEKQTNKEDQVTIPKFENEKINAVYQHYIHLKTALINNDEKEAEIGAKMLEDATKKANLNSVIKLATDMVAVTSIEAKRGALNALTNELANIFKKEKLSAGIVYKQYCPMANDGKGGSWLASESKIKNPYYGSGMLTCGSVEEEIK